MGNVTGIEWADSTFNIAFGCEQISPGCKNCYAKALNARVGKDNWGPDKPRETFTDAYWRKPLKWNAAAQKAGRMATVFCSSIADIGEDHPTIAAQLPRLWQLIRDTPWLLWLLLTKRADRWHAILPPDWGAGYPNVWPGVSIENKDYLWRLNELLEVPARRRFVSVEPLLGPLNLRPYLGLECHHEDSYTESDTNAFVCRECEDMRPPDWIIIGGESGNNARTMNVAWVEDIVAQCDESSMPIAVFVKQMGTVYGALNGGDRKGSDVIPAHLFRRETPCRLPESIPGTIEGRDQSMGKR